MLPVDFFQRKCTHKGHPITGPPVGTRKPKAYSLPYLSGVYGTVSNSRKLIQFKLQIEVRLVVMKVLYCLVSFK
jgi:hypothetical protein